MFHFNTLPPLSLYLHFPWCVRKCPYCDFNSHELKGAIPEAAYVEALLNDLEEELPRVWGRKVITVFIGGGTPSLLSPEALDRLLAGIRARIALSPEAEITLEANPGTAEQQRFAEFRAAGINRLSIGVQSFNDEQLRRLGRIHGRREAIHAAEMAHRAGFDNFNLDLMFALPEQTLAQAREDVATAIALEPTHLSYYQLTLEPNTVFHHQPPPLPGDELMWAIHQQGQQQLAAAGYHQYEVSAYARQGWQCRHNLNYWQFGDYLGIGAGAHGKITEPQRQRYLRRWKVRHPHEYLAAAGAHRLAGQSEPDAAEALFEFMLNALRLAEGFPESLLSEHAGMPLTVAEQPLRRAQATGLIEWQAGQIRPTALGYNHLNTLLELFLPDNATN
ncbi:MAG TPA: radical SAM family heme chaperone HemW [Gammaproteobacteria bacterium]